MATITTDRPASPPASAELAALTEKKVDIFGRIFFVVLLSLLTLTVGILAVLVVTILVDAWPVLSTRFWSFLTTGLASDPAAAGVWQGIKGSFFIGVIVAVVSFPLGISAAVYLEEYAHHESRFARLVTINIRNLAGVPSIVYGLLGLAVFVKWLGNNGQGGLTGGRTVIAGGLTLAVLVLPIVIITAQEALRAVPQGIREGSLALGATKWETIRSHVLPASAPGMLTGMVLSMARALGEAAPLLVVGAVTGVFFVGAQGLVEQIVSGRFTALPMVIFSWARQPGAEWEALTAAAGFVLIVMVFLMNGLAVYFRNRYERKW